MCFVVNVIVVFECCEYVDYYVLFIHSAQQNAFQGLEELESLYPNWGINNFIITISAFFLEFGYIDFDFIDFFN